MTHEIDKYRYNLHSNGVPVLDYSKDVPLYADEVADDAQKIMDAYGIPREFVGEKATFNPPSPDNMKEFVKDFVDLEHPPDAEKIIDLKYDENQDAYCE